MIVPTWPLNLYSLIIPFICLFWVLLTKRNTKDKSVDLKEIINKEKQLEAIRRLR